MFKFFKNVMLKFFKIFRPKEMTKEEIHKANPSELTDKPLAEYIRGVKRELEYKHQNEEHTLSYYKDLINVAFAEKTNRANTRFSKIAIGISISSLIVATIGIWQ